VGTGRAWGAETRVRDVERGWVVLSLPHGTKTTAVTHTTTAVAVKRSRVHPCPATVLVIVPGNFRALKLDSVA
jgi:hypothetical protein